MFKDFFHKSSYKFQNVSETVVETTIDKLAAKICPGKLKIAKIIPIYKKEDETLFTNYRPISLLPAIAKYLKKLSLISYMIFFVKQK